ncbi:MAG: 16S rRNA methyltransferase [Gammaproteobacteria bacterium]|nr:MAG: 16S rRNA methyltransferase [Gammaproteobacteria bacterium]
MLNIDFLSGKMQYRRQHASLRRELVARAMGAHPRDNPRIIDATAGLGRDSFILASLGFHITLLERSPALASLLQEAFNAAQREPATAPIIARMNLIQTDAIVWLTALNSSDRPDIIYLDPMFPARQKSAAVKKEMLLLQALVGQDDDAEALFQSALTCATRRVVVKRPRLAATIAQQTPSFSIAGDSSRFDIYLV